MKINLSKTNFSFQVIIILIVLLVYTFYFIDEELLVSLMTTFVLIGAYNMLSVSVNNLFMNNINTVFQKFSIYILMNLTILNTLVRKFDTISLFSVYNTVYSILLSKVFLKLSTLEKFFFNSVNLLIHNVVSFLLSTAVSKTYSLYIKGFNITNFINPNFFAKNLNINNTKADFVRTLAKLLLK